MGRSRKTYLPSSLVAKFTILESWCSSTARWRRPADCRMRPSPFHRWSGCSSPSHSSAGRSGEKRWGRCRAWGSFCAGARQANRRMKDRSDLGGVHGSEFIQLGDQRLHALLAVDLRQPLLFVGRRNDTLQLRRSMSLRVGIQTVPSANSTLLTNPVIPSIPSGCPPSCGNFSVASPRICLFCPGARSNSAGTEPGQKLAAGAIVQDQPTSR